MTDHETGDDADEQLDRVGHGDEHGEVAEHEAEGEDREDGQLPGDGEALGAGVGALGQVPPEQISSF